MHHADGFFQRNFIYDWSWCVRKRWSIVLWRWRLLGPIFWQTYSNAHCTLRWLQTFPLNPHLHDSRITSLTCSICTCTVVIRNFMPFLPNHLFAFYPGIFFQKHHFSQSRKRIRVKLFLSRKEQQIKLESIKGNWLAVINQARAERR